MILFIASANLLLSKLFGGGGGGNAVLNCCNSDLVCSLSG
jgi:hypothetical protein